MLIRGIDTLEFSLNIRRYSAVFETLLFDLEELKKLGQERGKEAEIMLNGLNLRVEKSGMPFYAYRLTCRDFSMGLASKTVANMGQVRVRLASGFLWSYGARKAYERYLEWLLGLGGQVERSRVSRVDICADADCLEFGPEDVDRFVTRGRHRAKHFVSDEYQEGRVFSGLTIGRGQPLLARIYDKRREIRSSGKVWFRTLWEADGWNSKDPVWRVEFQVRRKGLKELGIDSVEDLWAKENGLWKYLTEEWLALKRGEEKNSARRAIDERWTRIQKASYGEDVQALVREREGMMNQAVGLLVSIGAASNAGSLGDVMEMIRRWSNVKSLRERMSFEEMVAKRKCEYVRQGQESMSGSWRTGPSHKSQLLSTCEC